MIEWIVSNYINLFVLLVIWILAGALGLAVEQMFIEGMF